MTLPTRFCEQCGSALTEGVAFCESCGAAVPGAEAPAAEVPPTPAGSAVAAVATADASRGSRRWIPLVIGIVGVLIIVASIVSSL